MLKRLIVATAIAFALPAGAALAHENDSWWGDQEEHQGFHDEADYAHADAHARGFYSGAEHRGYHRALKQMHREFHYDHPDAYNDRRLPRERRRYYRSYGDRYYGSPYYGSGWSFSFGGGW